MKKIQTVVAVIGLAAAGALAWWWQNNSQQSTASAPAAAPAAAPTGGGRGGAGGGPAPVEVALAKAAKLTDDVLAVGSLKSNQGVMLRPEVSGRVARLGFADGQRVKRGQLLLQLDDTLQQAQFKQAEAQANIARTNLQRSRELLGQGFVSQSAVDQNAAAMDVANAQVALAQAQLARLKVLAPFDGTAGIRTVDVGDYVKDGADIVNIEDLSSLKVQFSVPERTIDRLRPGQAVEVAVDALPGRSFKGRVQAVDSQVEANGRSLLVVAQVDNPGALLKPGMFARARVVFAVREGAIVVPEEALVPLGGKPVVFKVVDGGEGKKIAKRLEVRIGLRLPGTVEILDGLQAGDTVVTAGHERLLRGKDLPVRVIDLAKAGTAAGGKPAGAPASGASPGAAPAGPAASAGRMAPA